MNADLLNEVFAEFCESHSHLDSMLSRVNPAEKSKVALLLSAFLRRPLTIAKHFNIELAATPEEFWSLGFLKLKKSKAVHELLRKMWTNKSPIPQDGGVIDFPPSMIEAFARDWGQETAGKMARLLSQDPLTTIRFKRTAFETSGALKPEVEAWLKTEGLPKSRVGRISPRARVFKGFARVQQNELFKAGTFEIQDEGSQAMSRYAVDPESITPFLTPGPQVQKTNEIANHAWNTSLQPITVIDACSGAGGKTLALADFLNGRGRVYGYDIYASKVRSLRERAERAGETNIQGVHLPEGDTSSLTKFLNTADVVLVDAPCSGLGVLRRNPDIKWNRKPPSVKEEENELPIEALQMDVLDSYAPLVKSGGRLVFGVCTFAKAESVDQVDAFVKAHADFEIESSGFVGPFDTDGFYMACLRKK